MLLNFAVTNYRSIKERQVFSMMAVDGLPHEESLIHSKDGISILPVALLFGANASGKSNILRAFGMILYVSTQMILLMSMNHSYLMKNLGIIVRSLRLSSSQ